MPSQNIPFTLEIVILHCYYSDLSSGLSYLSGSHLHWLLSNRFLVYIPKLSKKVKGLDPNVS